MADNSWHTAAQMPIGRQEIYADVYDQKIYTAGGLFNAAKSVSNQFNVYDPARNVWSTLAPLPETRHHISISIMEDQLYAIGGFTGGFPNWRANKRVFVYELKLRRWRPGPTLPIARGEHVSAVVDGKIYVIGGRVRGSEDSATFQAHRDTARADVFDPAVGQWRAAANAPTARNSAAAAVIDGLIYVVGGRQYRVQPDGARRNVNLATLEVYDPEKDQWITRRPMPAAQGGLSAATLKGKLYAFGGEQWVPTKKVLKHAWVYDPKTDEWTALPHMKTPRHGTAAAAVGQRIFVIGGATKTGAGEVATTESLLVAE